MLAFKSWKTFITVFGLLAPLTASAGASLRTESPWGRLSSEDLHAVHDTLLANHPGPFDTLNPGYRDWLENGLVIGLAKARGDRDFHDYERTLRAYVMGFRDGHTSLVPAVEPAFYEWPGFLTGLAPDGSIVVGSSEVSQAGKGESLISCDGLSGEQLFAQRVAPYRWNRDIASERGLMMPYALLVEGGEDRMRLKSCRLRGPAGEHEIQLQWRRINSAGALAQRRLADDRVVPELGLRKINGIWLISIPSFQYQSDADVSRFKAFLADVKARTDELRIAPKVIIDVRGNPGGVSAWGIELAGYLWGRDLVDTVKARYDVESDDWRASKSNLAQRETFLRNAETNGLPADIIAEMREVRRLMVDAIAHKQPLAHESGRPVPAERPLPPGNLAGTVYLFTDEICASSCLDFVDVVRNLPRVIHIGRATSADALYIDVDSRTLPSGLMTLSYSMKVSRNKVRGNNKGYNPAFVWPGGLMTDEAIARWVATLPEK